MLDIFKKIYFATLMVIALTILFLFTSVAEAGDLEYSICAQRAFIDYQQETRLNPMGSSRKICAFLDAEIGQECADAIKINQELGFLDAKLERFLIEKIIEPKCGIYQE